MGSNGRGAPAPARRVAALLALLLAVLAALTSIAATRGDVLRVAVAPCLVLLIVALTWSAAVRVRWRRLAAAAIDVLALVALVLVVLSAEAHGFWLLVVLGLVAVAIVLGRYALRREDAAHAHSERAQAHVDGARRGALIMNPWSGGGKVERFHLVDEARRRGIEPIVLRNGDDLLELAQRAVEEGADVLGMAGGDGSQALVASVAMRAKIPFVCVPAGTRNHLALDLGLDRDDVVGALDAFGEARERRIDLASVNDRVFVNNVSLGVYAKIVQSPAYRDAKAATVSAMLPELLGPDAAEFGLSFTGPDGREHADAQLILVSNNPYVLTRLGGFGTRPRLDTGELGVTATSVRTPADVARLAAAESAGRPQRYEGWLEWSTPELVIDADHDVEVGIDGEALTLTPPLSFKTLPGVLQVRVPHGAVGASPATLRARTPWSSIADLVRIVAGFRQVPPVRHPARVASLEQACRT